MGSKRIKKTLAVFVVLIVIAAAAALALTRSPDYLAGLALRFMFRPDDHLKKELVQEVGREKADELLKEFQNTGSGATAKPGNLSGALLDAVSRVQLEEKGVVGDAQYGIYSSIVGKYQTEFSSIQADYEQRINSLVGSAKQDYRQAGGKNLSSARELFEQYKASGEALEADCDQHFNGVLSAMEAELQENGLPTVAVTYAKSAYIVMKDNYREEILGKALEAVQKSK